MREISLQQFPGVWRADSLVEARSACVPTGFPALDAALGGGWPCPAFIELLCDEYGIGELQLLIPLLKWLSTNEQANVMLWLNPPYELQAVALIQQGLSPAQHWISSALTAQNTLWSMEHALRSGACSFVAAWSSRPSMASLRRLKLAAAAGRCQAVLFRPTSEATSPSPANLRAVVSTQDAALYIHLLKVQGRLPTTLLLPLPWRSDLSRSAAQ